MGKHSGLAISARTNVKDLNIRSLSIFLNQARAGRAWFLRIASVRECLYVCVCACVSALKAINN